MERQKRQKRKYEYTFCNKEKTRDVLKILVDKMGKKEFRIIVIKNSNLSVDFGEEIYFLRVTVPNRYLDVFATEFARKRVRLQDISVENHILQFPTSNGPYTVPVQRVRIARPMER